MLFSGISWSRQASDALILGSRGLVLENASQVVFLLLLQLLQPPGYIEEIQEFCEAYR